MRSPHSRRVPFRLEEIIDSRGGERDLDRLKTRIADRLELGASTFYSYLESQTFPPDIIAPLAEVLTDILGVEAGADFCQEILGDGWLPVRAELPAEAGGDDPIAVATRAIKEASEQITAIAEAAADGKFTPQERETIAREALQSARWSMLLVRLMRKDDS